MKMPITNANELKEIDRLSRIYKRILRRNLHQIPKNQGEK